MKISFHGADQGVTGSCHLLECAGKRILIDCGMYQGGREIFEENAEQSDQSYATGFSHERAFAICVTHAIVQPSESQFECEVSNGAYENTVDYRLRLYVESSNGDTWHSDGINLLGYGDGARYRSSSNAKRRYDLRVVDDSKKSLFCKERYDVFWRARTQGPAITNDIQIAPK